MKSSNKIFFLILLIYAIPLVIDGEEYSREIIWLFHIFPSVLLPFIYGKKGGYLAAFLGTVIHGSNELIEIFIHHEVYSSYNLLSMFFVSIVNVTVAITIGILVEKLKTEQRSLKKAVIKMEYMAFHDHLTGLPNKWNYETILQKAIINAQMNNEILAVLVLDLDRFKLINESLGHTNGDQLLKKVSKRLLPLIKKGDFLARQGGDEFLLLLTNIHSKEEAEQKIIQVLDVFQEPFQLNTDEYLMTCSVGVSFYPDDGKTCHELIQHADIAMYSAKDIGGNGFQIYNLTKLEEINDVVKIEAQLRKAIQQNEFTLHYQPLVNLQQENITGMEALLRWHNQYLGSISPEVFIPIAEEIGMIGRLGEWVLMEACTQTKILSDLNKIPLKVAVNISSKQFQDKNFVDIISNTLKKTGLPPSQLELEITESVSLNNMDEVILKLTSLKMMGITIAIDDFGTGYSSISYLKYLPVDTIKIDQSFIRNMLNNFKDKALVEGIISLSKIFGFNVTAEGVENMAQLELLKSFHCGQAQGYLFSKPVTIQDIYQVINYFNDPSNLLQKLPENELVY
jgi:diguanylate cyclase (GGDEF)-like protein